MTHVGLLVLTNLILFRFNSLKSHNDLPGEKKEKKKRKVLFRVELFDGNTKRAKCSFHFGALQERPLIKCK